MLCDAASISDGLDETWPTSKRPEATIATHHLRVKQSGDEFEVVSAVADAGDLSPWCLAKLAEALGSFAGQLTETGLEAVTVEYHGHVASLNTRPLTALILVPIAFGEHYAVGAQPELPQSRCGKRCLQGFVDTVAQCEFQGLENGVQCFGEGKIPQVPAKQDFRGFTRAGLEPQPEAVA